MGSDAPLPGGDLFGLKKKVKGADSERPNGVKP
jgi:hypothetical protein